jgi:hypothetical protein
VRAAVNLLTVAAPGRQHSSERGVLHGRHVPGTTTR